MKVTEEQAKAALALYLQHAGGPITSFRAAIESLPEPLPRLRPLAEMPAEVPEGAVRLKGFKTDSGWAIGEYYLPQDEVGLDVLPPLPESPKPSLQDELVTALESYFEVWDNKDKKPGWCGRVEIAKNRVNELIAKAKGVQQ